MKTKTAVLNGKPDAGNPHVRFRSLTLPLAFFVLLTALPSVARSELLFSNETIRADWQPGKAWWTNLALTPSVTDWSGYDRLAVRLANESDEVAYFGFYAAGPSGRVQKGFRTRQLRLRPYERACVIRPLAFGKGTDPRNVTRCLAYLERSVRANVRIEAVWLLKKGEKVPTGADDARLDAEAATKAAAAKAARQEADEAADAAEHVRALKAFVADCRTAGTANAAFAVGRASSMEAVRPRAGFRARPAKELVLRLARNERESVQLVVAQTGTAALKQVQVRVTDLKADGGFVLPASAVKAAPVGYVRTHDVPPYQRGRALLPVRVGWWPDPILEFPLDVTVANGDVQAFWLRVTCPKDLTAGTYRGTVTVSALCDGKRFEQAVPVSVRVNGFALPDTSVLPLAITFLPRVQYEHMPTAYRESLTKVEADPEAPMNVWRRHRREWTDFLADYFITTDSIAMEHESYDTHPHPDIGELVHLQAQGRLGFFNLGYWHVPGKGEAEWNRWCDRTLPRLRRNYAAAKAAGFANKAYIYGCDELNPDKFAAMVRAVDCLKKEFPGVPLFTTSFDSAYGTGDSPLGGIDWFSPNERDFDAKNVAEARAAGHQVWWYLTCGNRPPEASLFVESLPIELRLLMGAMTAKRRPDGFLFWQTSCWNSPRPISSGPFTDWDVRSFSYYHGDGYLVACGPDGIPLATQRLENFRDGLEDLAYLKLLRDRQPKSPLLDVPAEVLGSRTDFTEDPDALLRWRNALADELEAK